MVNTRVQKWIVALLVTLLCLAPFSASAAVSLDEPAGFTIEVVDRETKETVGGAVFHIYFMATAHTAGDGISFSYTDEFKDNGMDMGDFSDTYLPVHLMAYANEHAIPYTEVASNDNGKVFMEDLRCGAYLVVPYSIAEGYITPTPFILHMPYYGEGTWWYHVISKPKAEVDRGPEEKTYIRVKKEWKNTDSLPDSIAVTLTKDKEKVETVLLNAQNHWEYSWENLDNNHAWYVSEPAVPEGFKVSYNSSENTVTITNTYQGDTTTTPTTAITTTASGGTTTVPSGVITTVPSEGTTTTGEGTTTTGEDTTTTGEGTTTTEEGTTTTTKPGTTTTHPDKLIQTGQLNWPVPIMLIVGLVLLSIGWAMLNLSKKDEEDV